MALCELCDLDDSMCAHSPGARRAVARGARRPRRGRRLAWYERTTGSNRGWQGERVLALDFLREPEHMGDAASQLDSIWDYSHCGCLECFPYDTHEGDPAWDELSTFSAVALEEAMDVLMRAYPDPHNAFPRPGEWLEVVRQRHAAALQRQADEDGVDDALADRSRSQRPPARWMGRSPGYYSRGR